MVTSLSDRYSRDGYHWSRPVIDGQHMPFLPENDEVVIPGTGGSDGGNWPWNKAMVQSVGGGFTISPNVTSSGAAAAPHSRVEAAAAATSVLRFFVSARSGVDQITNFPEQNGSGVSSTGVAELRRDGFASVSAALPAATSVAAAAMALLMLISCRR